MARKKRTPEEDKQPEQEAPAEETATTSESAEEPGKPEGAPEDTNSPSSATDASQSQPSESEAEAPKSVDASETESASAPCSGAETETTVDGAEAEKKAPVKLLEPRIISTWYDEICRRLGDRVRISKAWHSRSVPALGDSDAKSDFDKEYKESTKLLRHASYAVNEDMKCLTVALANIQIDYPELPVGEYIDGAYFAVPRPPKPVDEDADEDGRTVKKGKDLPGQQKLGIEGGQLKVKDDGSVAEAAGECTSRALVEGEDVTATEDEFEDELLEDAVSDVLNSLTIELVTEIQSMNRESAVIVLQEHIAANFSEIAELSEDFAEGETSLAEKVIARVLEEYPPKEDSVKPEPAPENNSENWDEPQRKEPSEEVVVDELSKKRGKKAVAKAESSPAKSPFCMALEDIFAEPAYKTLCDTSDFDVDGMKQEYLKALEKQHDYFLALYDWACDDMTATNLVPSEDVPAVAKRLAVWQLNRENVLRVEALKAAKPAKGRKKTEADTISY